MRVTSASWDGEKVILPDQVLEVRNVDAPPAHRVQVAHHDKWDPMMAY